MNLYDYYTENEILDICWYYGQNKDNLTYNQIAIIVENYENESEV